MLDLAILLGVAAEVTINAEWPLPSAVLDRPTDSG